MFNSSVRSLIEAIVPELGSELGRYCAIYITLHNHGVLAESVFQ